MCWLVFWLSSVCSLVTSKRISSIHFFFFFFFLKLTALCHVCGEWRGAKTISGRLKMVVCGCALWQKFRSSVWKEEFPNAGQVSRVQKKICNLFKENKRKKPSNSLHFGIIFNQCSFMEITSLEPTESMYIRLNSSYVGDFMRQFVPQCC